MHLSVVVSLSLLSGCAVATATATADVALGPLSVPPQKPNILWIIAEDLGPELGCYGTEQIWTPHIDGLARDGVRYTRAFTVTPVCSTSRSAFMTGMYSTTIGTHNHRSHRRDGYQLPKGVRVITDRLREAGYFTANIRDLTGDPKERFYRGTGKTDWNFKYDGKPFDSGKWSELSQHQPFYAQINFSETHRGAAWNNAHKHIEKTANPALVEMPPYYPDHPDARKDWAQYLNTAMSLDKKVGFVLKKLETDGLADNTIVVFFGDHGRAHVRGKQWCYDSGLRVPLLIRWPKGVKAPKQIAKGKVDDRIIASIDLAATTLALAGVEKVQGMQGRVFLGADADPDRRHVFGTRDRCDETVFRIRTVRDARFRYIRNFMPDRPFLQLNRYKERSYPMIKLMRELHKNGKLAPLPSVLFASKRPKEELYDTDADPWETVNLATSAKHKATLARLRNTLHNWIETSHDQGRTPEPKEVTDRWERTMKQRSERRRR
jgi:N-sulfoglucosamine sulfohydrolase